MTRLTSPDTFSDPRILDLFFWHWPPLPRPSGTNILIFSRNFDGIAQGCDHFVTWTSGYTVVGLPNDSAKRGFIAIRWWGIGETVSMLIVFPRLRRLSIVRDHESPGDFIRDRYRSPSLSILIVFSLCLPMIIYIGTNIFAAGSILESLTDGELNFYWVVGGVTIIMLVFEVIPFFIRFQIEPYHN